MKRSEKGIFTVELAIIFPVIFLSILVIIFMSIVHYQNIATSAAVMQSANRISAYWQYIGDGSMEMLNGTRGESAATLLIQDDFKHRDPYRAIIDTKKGGRIQAGQEYANSLIYGLPSFYSSSRDAHIEVKKGGNFIIPYVEVSAERTYTNPLGRLFEPYGVGAREKNTVRAKAPLTANVEFIRNIDFVGEMIEKNKR